MVHPLRGDQLGVEDFKEGCVGDLPGGDRSGGVQQAAAPAPAPTQHKCDTRQTNGIKKIFLVDITEFELCVGENISGDGVVGTREDNACE